MKIILIGASGSMGQAMTQYLSNHSDEGEIYAGLQQHLGSQDFFPSFNEFRDLSTYIEKNAIKPDLIIDFSTPVITHELLSFSKKFNLPLVLATTGHNVQELEAINEAAKYIAILNTNNTSLGIAVFLQSVYHLTKALYPLGYDMEIIESHHRFKADAPSGTALMIKSAMEKAIVDPIETIYGRQGIGLRRPHHQIAVHAIRAGNIVGEHKVIFANNQEVIELVHRAQSRELFVRGALACGDFLMDKQSGLYTISDLLS